MSRHDFVEPYYMVQLSDGDLHEMQTYISKLKDKDYHHEKIIHNNPIHSQGTMFIELVRYIIQKRIVY